MKDPNKECFRDGAINSRGENIDFCCMNFLLSDLSEYPAVGRTDYHIGPTLEMIGYSTQDWIPGKIVLTYYSKTSCSLVRPPHQLVVSVRLCLSLCDLYKCRSVCN